MTKFEIITYTVCFLSLITIVLVFVLEDSDDSIKEKLSLGIACWACLWMVFYYCYAFLNMFKFK